MTAAQPAAPHLDGAHPVRAPKGATYVAAFDLVSADEGEDDPFEAFNRAMGMGVVEDPYPNFATMRERGHFHAGDPFDVGIDDESTRDGSEAMDLEGMPPVLTACTYEAVQQVLRDGETFSSGLYADVMGAVMGHSILEMDEPEHHTYRALIQQAFTRKAMEGWEAEVVAPIVHGLIDRFAADGRTDLVRSLLFPFPISVIAAMLGLPAADLPRFHRLGVELIAVNVDLDKALAASGQLREYFAGILAERRADPSDDLISVLAEAEHDGVRLTDEEIFAFLRLLLPAGAETTYRSSSNLLHALLTHPDQLDAVRADRGLIAQAIEEGLRYEPPLLMIARTATRDTEICGEAVAAGSIVITALGSANRDDDRWPDAHRFDIHRESRPHAAFAHGPHTCLGMHLARMETTVVLNAVLDRLPGLRLDTGAAAPDVTGMTFRAPPGLPVVWDT